MQAELIVESTGRGHVIKVAQRFIIGRGHDVSIRLDDEAISRHHAEVELRPDGRLSVTDLGSRNGTLLGGRRLEPRVPASISAGDRITLGNETLRVEVERALLPLRRPEDDREATVAIELPLLPADEFKILGEIGHGAMGTVFAAVQTLLDRRVAVKVLLVEDPDSRERLMIEGQTAARIHSPFVVHVHDIRLGRGRLCLIMELINGPSVRDRLRAEPRLPLADALRIAEHVALGLVAAHEVGVVHRDIKPANILLDPDGLAKVTDFGIAKDLLCKDRALTDSNLGLGSLPYVSPEQVSGAKHVGPSTDLYSLGATLYHMLSGQTPFKPTSPNILVQLAEQPPPPLASLVPGCPPDVVRFVHALLEKEPAARPANASSVARQLRELREMHVPSTVEPLPDAPDTRKSRAAETRPRKLG